MLTRADLRDHSGRSEPEHQIVRGTQRYGVPDGKAEAARKLDGFDDDLVRRQPRSFDVFILRTAVESSSML
jgi:hypothetical protein